MDLYGFESEEILSLIPHTHEPDQNQDGPDFVYACLADPWGMWRLYITHKDSDGLVYGFGGPDIYSMEYGWWDLDELINDGVLWDQSFVSKSSSAVFDQENWRRSLKRG